MEKCIKCDQHVSANLLKEGVCVLCETAKHDTVERLQAKIAELEHELQKLKAATEKSDKLLSAMWGDNFNTDSLH